MLHAMTSVKKTLDYHSEAPPVELYPFKYPLDRGDKGLQVMWIQSKLMKHDCYEGELDGRFNLEVSKSVRRFQTLKSLTVTGIVDRKTWTAL